MKELWISVKDKLPEDHQRVLAIIHRENGQRFVSDVTFFERHIEDGVWKYGYTNDIPYWMPLELPDEVTA